jgi:hypothetical protein
LWPYPENSGCFASFRYITQDKRILAASPGVSNPIHRSTTSKVMSTGAILTVLSNIPWGQVVDNAPKVAEGAAKLWSSVSGFRSKKTGRSEADTPAGTTLPSDTDVLRARIQSLEEAVGSLQEQMQASSELIKALADQNTQLVQRIELNRAHTQRVGIALTLLVIALAGTVVFLVQR